MITPSDWKIDAMPEETEIFYSGRALMPYEYKKLILGLKPNSMEDKWFVYYQKQKIYFHRSWTGHCIFIAEVEDSDSIRLGKVISNKKPEQFGLKGIEEKKDMFNKLIDYLLSKKFK